MSHAIEHGPNPANEGNGSGHEHREASVKLIAYAAVALAVTIFIVMALMWGTFNLLKNQEQAEQTNSSPLAPAIQIRAACRWRRPRLRASPRTPRSR